MSNAAPHATALCSKKCVAALSPRNKAFIRRPHLSDAAALQEEMIAICTSTTSCTGLSKTPVPLSILTCFVLWKRLADQRHTACPRSPSLSAPHHSSSASSLRWTSCYRCVSIANSPRAQDSCQKLWPAHATLCYFCDAPIVVRAVSPAIAYETYQKLETANRVKAAYS